MAIPLVVGSALQDETILKDGWRLAFENVNSARMEKLFNSSQNVWVTYINPLTEPAPVGLDVPKYALTDVIKFSDSATLRNIYIYAVDKDAKIRLSA